MALSQEQHFRSLRAGLGSLDPPGTGHLGRTANFKARYRYTGAALTSDLAWLVGAGFAPLVALGLSAHFGMAYVSFYLLSGAVGSLAALSLNRALEGRDD